MPPQDLLLKLRQRPFEPFRIHVSDGTVYDVHHPELVMVGLASAVVGQPAPNQTMPLYDQYESIDLRHVVRLVPVATPSTGNGM